MGENVQRKTYWPEIKEQEDKLDNQDAAFLIQYIEALQKKKMLTRHMLFAIAEHSSTNPIKYWNVLHKLAGNKK